MIGKIPKAFIDQLLIRVDLVEVIEGYVPLTHKGREYQARCPFHEEKTPSFTVSPSKQFYYCFGCGAHGTAIGFLMEYANLSFVEAVEELAAKAGVQMPTAAAPAGNQHGESATQLFAIVAQAQHWFQQQLRTHAEAKQAIAYLKRRGLDGPITAEFGLGYAPSGWTNLAAALGDNPTRRRQLQQAGLLTQRQKSATRTSSAAAPTPAPATAANLYDRFRGRVIFPIEDYRGRVVAFGGRIVGDGEPKYLNSSDTPLFHKGAELYGLHRARREIARTQRSLVVEGYLDVVSLAQFGIHNVVATMGTATTSTHVQRLFRLAAEIVFCFDGDRAGREAAWKAMQVALPEMHDGRQIGFLLLPEGEDPDSLVRAERQDGFAKRIQQAAPLPDFLLNSLVAQVDMQRMDGRARLVALAKPLLAQLPDGALREMMFAKLSSLSGLLAPQLGNHAAETPPRAGDQRATYHHHHALNRRGLSAMQISPLALAISLLLQNPPLAASIAEPKALQTLTMKGAEVLLRLLEKIAADTDLTTARLLEAFRGEAVYAYLTKLATRTNLIEPHALAKQFNDTLARLLENQTAQQRLSLIEKFRQNSPQGADKQALQRQIKELLAARKHG